MGIIDENWNYEIDIGECEKRANRLFELQINTLCESILKALDKGFINIVEDKDCLARNNDEELKLLFERNKEIKQDIEIKLKELSQQQAQFENFKRDQKLLKQEVKETHEAFLMARKHFKKSLNIYYSIESRSKEIQIVFVQFFTELKKNGDNYSVCLLKNIKTRQYTLQSTNPTIKLFKELQRRLQENNDVAGVLCYIREAFIAHKLKDKEH
ncbi:uncharacterized protein LOC123871805 [Maniola jurtina]|uniref:uncharacterized protein LOC123871805 n=1 Tax=Maniola jurtina TaxID=191418 RepID=UPI001E68ED65|nr:uncharacterized protein LOC123871805 [Maniola jurtina]